MIARDKFGCNQLLANSNMKLANSLQDTNNNWNALFCCLLFETGLHDTNKYTHSKLGCPHQQCSTDGLTNATDYLPDFSNLIWAELSWVRCYQPVWLVVARCVCLGLYVLEFLFFVLFVNLALVLFCFADLAVSAMNSDIMPPNDTKEWRGNRLHSNNGEEACNKNTGKSESICSQKMSYNLWKSQYYFFRRNPID